MPDTAPLVPPEVDLRGLPGFMLDVNRLLASELVALGTDAERWAALMLWCRAWHQIPAASLPDEDRVLAAFAGVSQVKWRRIREMAMRGFVLCSDGRYYHQVLAEEALQAWARRVAYRERRQRDSDRMQRWRASRDALGDAGGDASVTRHKGVTDSVTDAPAPASRDGPVTRKTGTGTGTETGRGTMEDSPPMIPPSPGGMAMGAHPDDPPRLRLARRLFIDRSADKGLSWSWARENGALLKLVERSEHEADPDDWLRRYIDAAWRLREGGQGPWRSQPWTPHTMCGGLMPRVVEEMDRAPPPGSSLTADVRKRISDAAGRYGNS